MKVCVIGAGLGGLLSAALLSAKGYEVDVFEKLPFYGGRFTSINYRGFEVSTGALHMIPHGSKGPLATLLKKAGSDVEIVDSEPEGEIFLNGKRIEVRKKHFPFKSRMKFFAWYAWNALLGKDANLDEFGKQLDEFSYNFMKSFVGWSFSVMPKDITFSKMLAVYRQVAKYRGPGIPIGGCKAVVESLAEIIESNDGKIHLKTKIEGLMGEDDEKVVRALFNGTSRDYDIFISNIGHTLTAKLLNDPEYERRYQTEPSNGIKYTLALKEPFIGHTGVLFTLNTRRISGMNEVTNADPSLAPAGYHMLQAHQPMETENVRYEIGLGLKDIEEILSGIEYEVISIQSYRDDWPVNRIKAGSDMGVRTPYSNLYVVGDGAKGDDIEVDGIALGVMEVMEVLEAL
jgi:phytoene dehydrogenase-like protein